MGLSGLQGAVWGPAEWSLVPPCKTRLQALVFLRKWGWCSPQQSQHDIG